MDNDDLSSAEIQLFTIPSRKRTRKICFSYCKRYLLVGLKRHSFIKAGMSFIHSDFYSYFQWIPLKNGREINNFQRLQVNAKLNENIDRSFLQLINNLIQFVFRDIFNVAVNIIIMHQFLKSHKPRKLPCYKDVRCFSNS